MVEALDHRVNANERQLFAGSGYLWGEFYCAPDSPRWHEVDHIGELPVVAFGPTPVQITVPGNEPVVTTANESLWYAPGVAYRRSRIGSDREGVTFLALQPDLADEVNRCTPTPLRQRACPARVLLLSRRLKAEVLSPQPDLLAIDDLAMTVLAQLAAGMTLPPPDGVGTRTAVQRVRSILADDHTVAWTLPQLAALVHYSPWFLSRAFRRVTGTTLSAYRQRLRLSASLRDALRRDVDLSTMATAYGFASHSHYTHQFRLAFGCTPTAARQWAGRPPRLAPMRPAR